MSVEDAGDLLRRHRLRSTPQRRAILGAFRDTREEHLSAEEVLSRASVAVPEIGRGTVYATLVELAELGVLASVGNAESIRYETNVTPHDHFHCRVCTRMFDVDLGRGELPSPSPEGYAVESLTVWADGVCDECGPRVAEGSGGCAGRIRPVG
jgi:Fur family peroxide stress response transcriptional regulator